MRKFLSSWWNEDLLSADRLKVEAIDPEDAAYAQGRRWRALIPFSLAASEVRVYRFEFTKPIDLTLATQDVYDGGLTYEVFGPDSVEAGTFDSPIEPLRVNNKPGVPVLTSGTTIAYGGSLTAPGALSDVQYLEVGNKETVDREQGSKRGFPATVAYVRLSTLTTSAKAPKGVLKYEWTEDA